MKFDLNQNQIQLRKVIEPIEKSMENPYINLAVKTAVKNLPIAREVYYGSIVAKNICSVWDTLYGSNKDSELDNVNNKTIEECDECMFSEFQTDIIWNNIKNSIKSEDQKLVHDIIQTTINKITEGEIAIVEQALQSL